MAVLVTGGAGYIGSHTAFQLVENGYQVVVLDNLYSGHRWAVPGRAVFVEGDMGDENLVRRLIAEHKIESVLHFAAHIEVGESVEQPVKYYRNNVCKALTLIDACSALGVKHFIFSSTASVYGTPEHIPVSESAPLRPESPYGKSKLMTETILRDVVAAHPNMKCVILRYFNVAGARLDGRLGQATPRATHLIKVAAQAIVGKRPQVAIYGTDYPTPDGTGIRDYIHIEDLARAHLDALEYLKKGGASDVFNCGYGHGFSVREVLDTLRTVSGVSFSVVEEPRRPGDVAQVVADPSKIMKAMGWTPKYDDLSLICRTALDWERKYEEGKTPSFLSESTS